MKIVIFDTSIFIDELRAEVYTERIERIDGLVRLSSVVLAELWRGALNVREKHFLKDLGMNYPVLVPTESNWLESGQLLTKMRADTGFSPDKLRSLHFDVLIALTARTHGARLITSNRADFELIAKHRKFTLEVW